MNQELRQQLLTQAAVDAERYPVDLEAAVASALVKVRRRFLVIRVVAITAALVLTAGLVAWLLQSGDPKGQQSPSPSAPSLESIVVTSPAQSLNVGTKVNLKAAGKYSDGSSRDLQEGLSWTSSNEAMATVSAEGVVAALGAGPVTLSAAMEGISGSLSLSVAPVDGPVTHSLTSLRVTPDSASMVPGGKQQLTAVGTYNDGTFATLNVEAVWDTSNRSVAPVDGNGLVTAARPGAATITATLGGLQGVAAITVSIPPDLPVTALSLDPAVLTLKVGEQAQLTAIATYSDGTRKPVTNVQWLIDPPRPSADKIATVDATGLVTAIGGGTVTVAATLSEPGNPVRSQAVKISVEGRFVKGIVVSPAGPLNMNAGQSRQLMAVVTYSDGSKDSAVAWSLGSQAQGRVPPGAPPKAVVTVSNNGLVTGRSGGQATITASADGVSSNAVVVNVKDVAAPVP